MSRKKELSLEEDIERVLDRIESARGGYRPTFSLRPDLARRMQNIGEQYVPQDMEMVGQLPLSERVKAIYPVIHRTYDEFIDTKQRDDNADVQNVKTGWSRKKLILGILDNALPGSDGKERHDAGVKIYLDYPEVYYSIFRFRPEWRRDDPSYQKPFVTKRENGVIAPDDECIDMCSWYFKIDCCSPPEFVEALRSGDSEPKLRKVILQHLFSLPNILGNYLDKKERDGGR